MTCCALIMVPATSSDPSVARNVCFMSVMLDPGVHFKVKPQSAAVLAAFV
jgi:hypothetical protein